MKVNRKNEKEVDHLVDQLFIYNENSGKIYNKTSSSRNVSIGDISGYLSPNGYIYIRIKYKKFCAHRIAWRLYYGTWPKHQIDHINGNRSDNRIYNLREATNRQNCQNRMIHRLGKLPGIYFNKNKYCARIQIKYTYVGLGCFKTELEAHEQYLRAVKAIETREFKSAKELRDYLASTNKRAEV